MGASEFRPGRRRVLAAALALGGVASLPALAVARLEPTPGQPTGPFYPARKPLDDDNDLTVVAGRQGRAQHTSPARPEFGCTHVATPRRPEPRASHT